MGKAVLDACCGSRMFWFDKSHPSVVYMDNRELEDVLCDEIDKCAHTKSCMC